MAEKTVVNFHSHSTLNETAYHNSLVIRKVNKINTIIKTLKDDETIQFYLGELFTQSTSFQLNTYKIQVYQMKIKIFTLI